MNEETINWPDVLPVWQLSGYSHDPNLNLLRADEKNGFSPNVAIREKNPAEVIRASLNLDDLEFLLFEWFLCKKIYHGAAWFHGSVNRLGQMETRRIKISKLDDAVLKDSHWVIKAELKLYD